MKTWKLRGFGLHKHSEARDRKNRRFQEPLAQLDELSKASQDMQDMRDCYDSLLSAAAATTNSAYEFSESLREMGTCLLQKTALNDDEDSGRVLLMLGKLQFELQKLVDNYRSHIFRTITIPSESLLNELRTVEEMKKQCDEKRGVYEHMITRHRERGRLRSNKGETFSPQQLQVAHDEYDEEATLFLFRLKSLKEGQSRSLLTQAARHHAAQLCFFRKAVTSLETVDPHVKLVTEQQHIDYQFSGLDDDGGDDDNDDDYDDDSDSYDDHDDGELSFDYGPNDLPHDISTRNSMELDHVDLTFPQVATVDIPKENLDKIPDRDSLAFGREQKTCSQSAPLFAEKKVDPAERFRHMRQLSTRKFHTYVLPTPDETKGQVSTGLDSQIPQTRRASISGGVPNLWHSSPLEQKKYEKILGDEKLPRPTVINTHAVLKESNNNTTSSRLPPPLSEGLSLPQIDRRASDTKKIKRQAFSGPLSNQSWLNKSVLSSREPVISKVHPLLFSGPILRTPLPLSSSPPKVSPTASPPFMSSPKISELHELPRPPANSNSKLAARPYLVTHSSPLMSKGQEHPATNKFVVSNAASPLPTPPQTVPRSFSIPSRGQKATLLPVSEVLEAPPKSKMAEDIASPPLTPISLSIVQPSSTASETVIPVGQSRGARLI
ncbi:uncharacterized protein At2g33490 isoform X2 [Cornus florida]|uniref:uncharacterized protein At2g33490 isoform X2 n=1 Tax=Cornus florida TaxID=4283 RepID=UPI002899E070|nr:uncharacterized protein At2g33490 isoform X2 [Cornus florida]